MGVEDKVSWTVPALIQACWCLTVWVSIVILTVMSLWGYDDDSGDLIQSLSHLTRYIQSARQFRFVSEF